MIVKAETVTYPSGYSKTFVTAHINEILKFAAVNGFNRTPNFKLIEYTSPIGIYDTNNVTGYDFQNEQGQNIGFCVINKIDPAGCSQSIFHTDELTTTPVEYNNVLDRARRSAL